MDELDSVASTDNPTSLFQSNLPLEGKLERARTELLDLSARNRLLNIPRSSKGARIIEVVDEKTAEIFRILVKENRAFTFLPGRSSAGDNPPDAEEVAELAQPDDDSVDERGVLNRHADTKLQTKLTSAGLQKRLLDLYIDARTLEEEQGVNILFLALGTLKWIDPNNANNIRYAPLILVPVSLERGNAAERFKLKWRQEDHAPNLSLEAYLDRVHGLKLPTFELGEDFDPVAYLDAVRSTISSKPNWKVLPDDIVLGFFSFSKFLMYRDLDPSLWPEGGLTAQPLIRGLLADGFQDHEKMISEDEFIDPHIQPAEMLHIVDCDSSQTLAVHDVRAGRNLVIQGPPGTGKSQTIANIIASAIADGKTVLFVAEKMAALEVVKRRLDQAGVGDACLELHSNKANKRLVLEELRRTWELGSPRGDFPTSLINALRDARDELNGHVIRLHKKHPIAELSPYQVMGQLVRLRQEGVQPVDIKLENPEQWTADGRVRRETLLSELAERVNDIGCPMNHPWNGVELESIVPTEVDRLVRRIGELASRLKAIKIAQTDIASVLEASVPATFKDFDFLTALADRVSSAPDISQNAFSVPEWIDRSEEIFSLQKVGLQYKDISETLEGVALPAAWNMELSEAIKSLRLLPTQFGSRELENLHLLCKALPKLSASAERLKSRLGLAGPVDTVHAIEKAIVTAERVAVAPTASPEAFMATVWDHGVEQAGDVAESVASLERARSEIGNRLSESAWNIDLNSARQTLAAHGNGLFRFFSGEWRQANRLVKSVLNNPKLPFDEVLPLLDSLTRGQQALSVIRKADDFGKAAFGADWRGERSKPEPLIALVEWMRSLRGLGAEPRLIAGRLPDQSEIKESANNVKRILAEAKPVLSASWDDLGELTEAVFGTSISVERAELQLIASNTSVFSAADELTKGAFTVLPSSLKERIAVLDRVVAGQKAIKHIDDLDTLGNALFDPIWKGKNSDWMSISAVVNWVNANLDIRLLVSRVKDKKGTAISANEIKNNSAVLQNEMEELFSSLRTSCLKLFGAEKLHDVSTDAIAARFSLWLEKSEQLSKWVAYRGRANHGRTLGVGEIIDSLERGGLAPSDVRRVFDMAYYEAIFADQTGYDPSIIRFDGELHGRLAKEFADLDRQRIVASRLEVVRAHHRRIPQGSNAIGPLGVLRGEIARRRGHMPIRQLMQKAAPAVQSIKPVLMMSPLSVAQFLPPGQLTFDLLVMDEASQIQPIDALGAIARCRKIVVVGDERQLPPTKFFSKMTSGQSDEENDEAQVADIESILGLFIARGLPQRMLRWHYRSRHQSLIAVSNNQFYENKLFIVPSPYTKEAGMGLLFHHIPDGVFDSGNKNSNVVEAKAVAEAIIRHAKTHPEHSLGVGAFSVSQRRAIQDQVELLRRLNPETESFFNSHPSEPFFIKNLENIQGDERDVIFISVGYGRNPQGYMAMRFGPLSAEGGERRLNVLISRAKRRCEVFSSITDEDIDLERGKGKGVFAFKLFLHFARTGRLSIAQSTDREFDSEFERQVAYALEKRGYQVHPQVGIAGFFIDLAIADPERPGRYLIGIECDGVSYHRSKSARDRDRLRQAVLEDHGWIIHRIWSTDWFNRPNEQVERTVVAIENAKIALDNRSSHVKNFARAVPVEVVTIERNNTVEIGLEEKRQLVPETNSYIEAPPKPPAGYELHETPIGILANLVQHVVEIEGPVHSDEITLRLRMAWGLQRAGGRVQATVERAISVLIESKRIGEERGFLMIPGQTVKVRDRSAVLSASLRKPEMLPPREINTAILSIVRKNFGAGIDEIIQAVSRLLGFKSTSSQLRDRIQEEINGLINGGMLIQQGGIYVANEILASSAWPQDAEEEDRRISANS